MKPTIGTTFTQNDKTFTIGAQSGARSYSCTAEDGEVQVLSSRAIGKLLGTTKSKAGPVPTPAGDDISPSEPLDETRCLKQCEYLLGQVEHSVAAVRVVQALAQTYLQS